MTEEPSSGASLKPGSRGGSVWWSVLTVLASFVVFFVGWARGFTTAPNREDFLVGEVSLWGGLGLFLLGIVSFAVPPLRLTAFLIAATATAGMFVIASIHN